MTTLVQANGTWNATPTSVGEGTWPVVASVPDPAGNVGSRHADADDRRAPHLRRRAVRARRVDGRGGRYGRGGRDRRGGRHRRGGRDRLGWRDRLGRRERHVGRHRYGRRDRLGRRNREDRQHRRDRRRLAPHGCAVGDALHGRARRSRQAALRPQRPGEGHAQPAARQARGRGAAHYAAHGRARPAHLDRQDQGQARPEGHLQAHAARRLTGRRHRPGHGDHAHHLSPPQRRSNARNT